MSPLQRLKSLGRDIHGAYAVEFAMIISPLLMLLVGSFDFAYQLYAQSVLQGTVNAAARKATLEDASLSAIETYVRNELSGIASGSDVVITAVNFRNFSGIDNPEKITTDTEPLGTFNTGDCYIDENRNNQYDTKRTGAAGLGGAEYIVRYTVDVTFDRLTPLASYLGMGTEGKISRTALLRNEPYAGVTEPPTLCPTT